MIDGAYVASVSGPPVFQFMNLAEAAATVDGIGFVYAFRYPTCSDADADLTLQLVPRDVIEKWAANLGVTRTREMTQTELIWSYLNALGYMGLDAVFILSINGFSGDTAGGETCTFTGSGFKNGHHGATTLTVDGVPFTNITLVSDTSITAVSPAHAAEEDLDVVVTNDNGTFTLPAALDYVA